MKHLGTFGTSGVPLGAATLRAALQAVGTRPHLSAWEPANDRDLRAEIVGDDGWVDLFTEAIGDVPILAEGAGGIVRGLRIRGLFADDEPRVTAELERVSARTARLLAVS